MESTWKALVVLASVLLAGAAWADCACPSSPCEIQQCPEDQSEDWSGVILVNGAQHPINDEVQLNGLSLKYKGSSDDDLDGDSVVDGVKHEFDLGLDYTGEYDLVYRVRRYVKDNNESTWTYYDASSYSTLFSVTSASCQSNDDNCGDGEDQCGAGDGSCSAATVCWGVCTVAYGSCYHPPFAPYEDDCACSAEGIGCWSGSWWWHQAWTCALVLAKDQTLCVVEIAQWDTY